MNSFTTIQKFQLKCEFMFGSIADGTLRYINFSFAINVGL